ncbi:MAG: right-handed parallel beta-helix repeat-containing protein, partial [Planctomycetota bacterium]
KDGDTIEIDGGVYSGDVAVWRQNNLIIRGVGGRAHIKANGRAAEEKAIWVIKGDNVIVENVELSGAAVRDRNGAGIRQEGSGLTIRNCFFHHNENGILGGKGKILIEHTEFAHNGFGDGQSHNLYISGETTYLILRYSYSHHARVGHNVKSRAKRNYIFYNRIMDENDGNASYAIDLPEGGEAYIIGNLIQQGPKTDNSRIISYGAEVKSTYLGRYYIINNTIVNDRHSGTFIFVKQGATGQIINNIFLGEGVILAGPGEAINNLMFESDGWLSRLLSQSPRFIDKETFDYRLTASSPAIDAGIDPGSIAGFKLAPVFHYVHPIQAEPRIPWGAAVDVGAYEFTGTPGK